MSLFDFFHRSDKEALRWAMHHAASKTNLGAVYCMTDNSPGNKFCVRFTCRCTDPYSTGYSMDNVYCLFKRDGFLVSEAARGFLTEQVYVASRTFQETAFVNMSRILRYPATDWEEPPPRVYVCDNCRRRQTIPEIDCLFDWLLSNEGAGPPCSNGCGAARRIS